MIRVRAKEYDVLLRSGEELPPFGVAEVRADEAMHLHGLGLVELLSSARPIEAAVNPPRECRIVPLPPVGGVRGQA